MPWLLRSSHGAQTRTSASAKRRARLSVQSLEDRSTPAVLVPIYTSTFADAVTDDNAFTANDGLRYWTIDPDADNYQNDLYERPTAQTYQVRTLADGSQRFAAAEYFQNLDIVEARAGFDADFLYVSIKLAGLDKLTADGQATLEGLIYRYGFRIATQPDGGGGLLVVADQPELKNSPNTTFGQVGTFVYRDANGDVGGTGLDVTKQDLRREDDGNGYEEVLASDGTAASGQPVLWVRVSPTDPTVVEFALDYKALGFTADELANLPYFTVEANKGLQDPQNYLWNDEYSHNEAGSPYRSSHGSGKKSEFGTPGLENIYELDTLYLGAVEPPTTSSIGGMVFNDVNFDGIRNPNEFGISGVEVILTGVDDLGNSISQTTIADDTGSYIFADLRPGTYQVFEVQPFGFEDGVVTVGTVNGLPRGQLLDNDLIGEIALGFGENGIGYDFAEFSGDIS